MQAPIDLRAPKTMMLPASYEKSAVAWAYYEVHCARLPRLLHICKPIAAPHGLTYLINWHNFNQALFCTNPTLLDAQLLSEVWLG